MSNMKAIIMACFKTFHFVLSAAVFVLCWILYYSKAYNTLTERYDFLICTFYIVTVLLLGRVYNAYYVGYSRIVDIVYSQILTNIICVGILYLINCLAWLRFSNPLPLIGVCTIQFTISLIWAKLANILYFKLHKPKKTAIIYRNIEDLNRIEEIRNFKTKFTVVKEIEYPSDDIGTLLDQLENYEAIFVAGVNATPRNAIAKYCIEKNIIGFFVPHVGDIIMAGAQHIQAFSVPIVNVKRAKPSPEYLFIKRTFDILVSLFAIIVLSPFMLLTALSIKLYDHGPVLYKQIRLTKNGKSFKILKFRSMRTDAEKDGVARLSTENDERITPIGHIIRVIRFDELPQLFNILKGDMTIVGPRPERPEIAAQYVEIMPAFALRLQVKAGLTGYAQVYGKYNTEPYDKLEMDLMYINKMSVVEDLKLIFATVRILFMKESTSGIVSGQTTAIKKSDLTKVGVNKYLNIREM